MIIRDKILKPSKIIIKYIIGNDVLESVFYDSEKDQDCDLEISHQPEFEPLPGPYLDIQLYGMRSESIEIKKLYRTLVLFKEK